MQYNIQYKHIQYKFENAYIYIYTCIEFIYSKFTYTIFEISYDIL